ncbi:hypothetical protein FBULB1_11151 [Fusarium bulbicola]|nr:hypothetical protein FBULB1_11151 [Fusarium bulbicola]
MSFPNLRIIHPLSKKNGPPVGTKNKKQGSLTLNHMPTEEQDPPHPGNIPTNLTTIAVDGGDRTDHTQRHRETGDQSQWSCEDVNGTVWDPEFYPEGEIAGSPTELNSPTRYEVYTSHLEFPSTHRRSSRARNPTKKAEEIKDTELSTRKSTILTLVQDNDAKLVPVASSSSAPSRNRFLDSDDDLILPAVQELYEMTDSDKEEWQGARVLFQG